jgi:hypothetical protein
MTPPYPPRRIERRNVRRTYIEAMVLGDEETLNRIYAYLVRQGWGGGISVEDAIAAVEA